ncbi:MAG: hypothetical protein A2010_02005 [Nitrospirae bacterium GWD2_57_9]|nr:MAG: hypothetical protein A2010_02005 [Nitrospirae bacterium GWD2_57_9]OGW46026.1 MAG: hypothetical protein A2078_11695 [Nitrospirae bacterium GWC2_57_9]
MNKKKIVSATIAVVFACGLAFGGEVSAAAKESSGTSAYNGITYFDMGKTPDCGNTETASNDGASKKPFNGITQFDQGSAGSRVNGACAGRSPVQSARLYNGITVF